MSITRSLPAIAVASAAAGFGASFGRDIYRKTKDALPTVVIVVVGLAVILLPFVGIVVGARLWTLNYEDARDALVHGGDKPGHRSAVMMTSAAE